MADPLTSRTQPLYQKDSELHTHTSPITSLTPLSSFPPTTQSLFKPSENSTALILTTSATIFHAQGGGQPSDTGSIRTASATFHVHQVRAPGEGGAILHMGTLDGEGGIVGEEGAQSIDVEKRTLHSRLHTAGHVLGLAVHELVAQGKLDPGLKDGKASHYPGAAYVEFAGLIPGSAKEDIQRTVDEMVKKDLPVSIHFWTEDQAREDCTGAQDAFKGDEDGVRVVQIGDVGSYPCGGTHVRSLQACGKIVVRGIKRQKGVSKVSYEVQDV